MRSKFKRAGVLTAAVMAPLFAFAANEASTPDMAPEALAELHAAIDILKTHHMNRARLDWPSVEAKAFEMTRGAKDAAGTYRAIWYIIEQLGEKHTFLWMAKYVSAFKNEQASGEIKLPPRLLPEGEMLGEKIGIVRVPGTSRSSSEYNLAYVTKVRDQLDRFKSQGICRFVVDLRGNGGGNMWPMVNGVASLLGTAPFGYFVYDKNSGEAWVLNGTWMGFASQGIPSVPAALALAQGEAPVAVLVDRGTGSAGEFTAIAFDFLASRRPDS